MVKMTQKWGLGIFYRTASLKLAEIGLKKIASGALTFWKIAHLGKFSFTSYRRKCSRPVELQDSLIINIAGGNQSIP